jgi:hypothetical protein
MLLAVNAGGEQIRVCFDPQGRIAGIDGKLTR